MFYVFWQKLFYLCFAEAGSEDIDILPNGLAFISSVSIPLCAGAGSAWSAEAIGEACKMVSLVPMSLDVSPHLTCVHQCFLAWASALLNTTVVAANLTRVSHCTCVTLNFFHAAYLKCWNVKPLHCRKGVLTPYCLKIKAKPTPQILCGDFVVSGWEIFLLLGSLSNFSL